MKSDLNHCKLSVHGATIGTPAGEKLRYNIRLCSQPCQIKESQSERAVYLYILSVKYIS